jgi:peptidoglycan hydrolase-like protein with peptidoglycan-binding domain
MKGSLRASIVNYLESLKTFRCFSKSQFYWLLLFSCPSIFLGWSAIAIVTAPQAIAQPVGINRPTLQVGSQGERVSELQAALKLLGFYSGTVDGNYNEATANAVSQFKQTVGLTPDGIVDAPTWQRLFPNQPFVSSTPNSTNAFPVPTQAANTTTTPQPRPTPPRPTTSQVVNTKPVPNRTNTQRVNNQVVNTKPAPRPNNTSRPNTTTTRPSSTTSLSPTPPANRIPGVQYTSEGWPILRVGMSNAEVSKLQRRLNQLGFLRGSVDSYFGVMTENAVKAAQKRYGITPDGVVGSATWEALLRGSAQRR